MLDEVDEEEEKSEDEVGSLWQVVYNTIAKNQKTLSAEEQMATFKELWSWKRAYEMEIFGRQKTMDHLISMWASRSGSSSKMGADYNSSKRGLNTTIQERIDGVFAEVTGNGHTKEEVQQLMLGANLSYRVLFHPDLVDLLGRQGQYFVERIRVCRTKLVSGIYMMISDVALGFGNRVAGSSLEYPDLFQQGALAAYEATMAYNPQGPNAAKWSSFAYSWVTNAVSKYIADTSRLVSLPRYVIEEWNAKYKGEVDIDAIEDKDKRDLAAAITSRPISFDQPVYHDDENSITLGDTIGSEDDTEAETIEKNHHIRVRAILDEWLSPDELLVVALRWGLGDEESMGVEQTVREYVRLTGRKLSKDKINELEANAKRILSNSTELREIWEDV